MTARKRIQLLIGALVLLAVANLYVRLGGDRFEAGAFWNDTTDLTAAYSAKLQKTLSELERMPRLSFITAGEKTEETIRVDRNPFIFGVDRRAEEQQRQRLEELATIRAQIEEAEEAEPVVEAPAQPSFDGKVLGVLENRNARELAVSLLYGDELHILRVGDRLAGEFEVLGISYTGLALRHLPSRRELKVEIGSE